MVGPIELLLSLDVVAQVAHQIITKDVSLEVHPPDACLFLEVMVKGYKICRIECTWHHIEIDVDLVVAVVAEAKAIVYQEVRVGVAAIEEHDLFSDLYRTT